MSGYGFEGDRRPSSLRATFVRDGALNMGIAELTEVGETLEFVQTPLEEAGCETCRCRSHVGIYGLDAANFDEAHTTQQCNDAAVVRRTSRIGCYPKNLGTAACANSTHYTPLLGSLRMVFA